MRDETSTILRDLKETELFRSAGKPVEDENVIVLKSWSEGDQVRRAFKLGKYKTGVGQ